MRSRIWLIYGAICMSMGLHLFWSLSATVCKEQVHVPTQDDITDSNKRPLNNYIGKTSVKPKTSNAVTALGQVKLTFPPTFVWGKNINAKISHFFTMKSNEKKDTFVNLHRYRFSINSNLCLKGDLFLIMVVHSAPNHFRKRTLVRTTYGSIHSYKGKKMSLVFMLGDVKDKTIQEGINNESKLCGDIVQGNFQDTYETLVKKHIMDMHWFKHYCNADFILKLDDDTFINPFRVVEYITNVQPKGVTIHCRLVLREKPFRNTKKKWHTTLNQYPFPVFPPFCLGFAYLTTPETWTAMYMASKYTRMMDMDDVYVSAILGMKIQVEQINFEDILYKCPENTSLIETERLNNKAIFIDRRTRCGQKPFRLWKDIRNTNTQI